jgi:hypothetical protein
MHPRFESAVFVKQSRGNSSSFGLIDEGLCVLFPSKVRGKGFAKGSGFLDERCCQIDDFSVNFRRDQKSMALVLNSENSMRSS